MGGMMEGELKAAWITGWTELRGTAEGEGVLMKHLIKAGTDITFILHMYVAFKGVTF